MATHEGRVVASGERNDALRFCPGTLAVDDDQLVVQGAPHDNGRDRRPVTIGRASVATLHLRCGLFGATLTWENAHGYRNHLIRVRDAAPLLADLEAAAWPLAVGGWRRPRT